MNTEQPQGNGHPILAYFLLGGLVWRLGVEIIPWVGLLVYFAAVAWGTGGWVMAAWQERQRVEPPQPLLPPAMGAATSSETEKDGDDQPL